MPELVHCPECDRKLRVPDDLIGQAVKCPTCSATFTATAVVAPPADASPPEPAAPIQESFQSSPEQPALTGPDGAPSWRAPADVYYDHSKRDREWFQRQALNAVNGPAIGLLVTGILDLVYQAGTMVVIVVMLFIALNAGGGRGGPGAEEIMMQFTLNGVGMVVGVVKSVMILIGARKMKRLESYGFAMASAILAMVPCSWCCLLGLPFGIWALVVINRPEVKDAFAS